MGLSVARTSRAAKEPITGDSVTDTIGTGQVFGVDMEHVARRRSVVLPDRHCGCRCFRNPSPLVYRVRPRVGSGRANKRVVRLRV
jgi:hypothetical protein